MTNLHDDQARADRLRKARADAGYSSVKDASEALGVGYPTYAAHENASRGIRPDAAERYARKFKVSSSWLLFGDGEASRIQPSDAPQEPPNAIVGEKLPPIMEQAKIPLYGHAVAGVDGEFVLNGNKLDDITAPPSLLGIHGAFAVTVSGDSMEPRYEDGETLFLDPRRRVSRGDYVVAQVQMEEEGPTLAYIKKFVRHNSKELVLEQFNPPKLLTFPHEYVVSVDYVVMGGRVF